MTPCKNISDPPQLCEIVRELLKEGTPYYEDQEKLAHELGTDSPTISKIKYRALLHDHIAETHDGIMRRVIRIESTLEILREKGSRVYPPVEIPKRWRKK